MNDDSTLPAIALTDLSLSFGAIEVLRRLNLTVRPGERVALVGRSGSGKTSLLAIICGLLKASSGQVQTLGHAITDADEDTLCRLRQSQIGVVFQHFHLIETMTALENTALPLNLAQDTTAETRAEEILRAVGLGERLTHFPSQLSGGEQQRVAIARAFISTPPLLLADEPTGNLDDETGKTILDILFGLSEQHKSALLFVTHNTGILDKFDRVLRLQNGVIHSDSATAAHAAQ